MICPACQVENKEGAKVCKKCGVSLTQPPLWKPTWRWHLRTLGMIYAGVLIAFFALKWVLKGYVRELPPEITPWLHKTSNR